MCITNLPQPAGAITSPFCQPPVNVFPVGTQGCIINLVNHANVLPEPKEPDGLYRCDASGHWKIFASTGTI